MLILNSPKNRLFLLAILLTVFLGLHLKLNSQENFKWERVVELKGSRLDLHTKATKVLPGLFNWSYSEIDDTYTKFGMRIWSATEVNLPIDLGMDKVTYYFTYVFTVEFKDNKYRVEIDDLSFGKSFHNRYTDIPLTDNYDGEKSYNISKRAHKKVMRDLKATLTTLINSFERGMKNATLPTDEW
jgi:hypothetical protein